MFIKSDKLEPREHYHLLTGIVVPRPIAWVSTISSDGIPNLAPFSFFMGLGSKPPSLAFSIVARRSQPSKKDTLVNIEATNEFVINTVPERLGAPMVKSATEYPSDVNEFEQSKLTPEKCQIVSPPRVKESPISLECKKHDIIVVGDGSPGTSYLIIGEIVAYHIDDTLMDNDKKQIDVKKLNPLARLNQDYYATLSDLFTIERK